MIIDALKNSESAECLHPAFKSVFDYVKSHDLLRMEPGRVELDGEDVYINVVETEGKDKSAAVLETHDEYIDIQFPLAGEETFAWKSRSGLVKLREAYNAKDDIAFYTDEAGFHFTLHPDEFAVFFPQDGHAPCIGKGKMKKAIAKVKVRK